MHRGRRMGAAWRSGVLCALALTAGSAWAGEVSLTARPERSPFGRAFTFRAYGTGWEGAYGGVGLGGSLGWVPSRWVGLDLFGEGLLVQAPQGLRHDHPVGFNLFMPLRLSEYVQLRPLFGMCVVASLIEPAQAGAPRADDLLFGAHGGVAIDGALDRLFSAFVEVKAIAWAGHDRAVQGWTGAVGNTLHPFVVGQARVGLTLHFGS